MCTLVCTWYGRAGDLCINSCRSVRSHTYRGVHLAHSKKAVVTQTEGLTRDTAVKSSGCRECLSLPEEGSACSQGEGLLAVVAELKEEVERLRNIGACEQEIGTQGSYSTSQREGCKGGAPQGVVEPLPCCCWAEGGDQKDEESWKQVPVWCRRQLPSVLNRLLLATD